MSFEEYLAVGAIFWMLVAIWWERERQQIRAGFASLFAFGHWVALAIVGLVA